MTGPERAKRLVRAAFGPHFLIFLAVCVMVLGLAAATDWRWLYWVALGWGSLLLLHYLIYTAAAIDQRWVDERTEELRLRSYDRDQIQSIRSRHGSDRTPDGDPGH